MRQEEDMQGGVRLQGHSGSHVRVGAVALPWGHPGRDVSGQVASSLEKPGLEAETGAPGHSRAGCRSPGSRCCEEKALMAPQGP